MIAIFGSHCISFCTFYRPQTEVAKGNVFTPVCHSVHRREVYTALGRPSGQTTPPPEMATAADGIMYVENEDIISLHSIDLLPLCWLITETFVVRNTEPVIASHSGRLLVAIFRSRYVSCLLWDYETASESRLLLKHSDWLASLLQRMVLRALRLTRQCTTQIAFKSTQIDRSYWCTDWSWKTSLRFSIWAHRGWEKDWNIRNLAWITIGLCTWKSTACSSFEIKEWIDLERDLEELKEFEKLSFTLLSRSLVVKGHLFFCDCHSDFSNS